MDLPCSISSFSSFRRFSFPGHASVLVTGYSVDIYKWYFYIMIMVCDKNENFRIYLITVFIATRNKKKSKNVRGFARLWIFMKGIRRMKKFGNYWCNVREMKCVKIPETKFWSNQLVNEQLVTSIVIEGQKAFLLQQTSLQPFWSLEIS
jgi:hypothetical protein